MTPLRKGRFQSRGYCRRSPEAIKHLVLLCGNQLISRRREVFQTQPTPNSIADSERANRCVHRNQSAIDQIAAQRYQQVSSFSKE